MQSIEDMLADVREKQLDPSELDTDALKVCIEACLQCQTVCSFCADACLHEQKVAELRRCIRLNLDCADLCATTVRLLSHAEPGDLTSLRALLEACASICSSCASECRKHADAHHHCGVCAAACEECARACQNVLETLFEGPSA
jgi:hypothetical protein